MKTNYKLIEDIIKSNGGYITRKDINRHNIPSIYLSNYVKEHNLEKYGTGFYAEQSWIPDYHLIFQYEYPKFIYSFYTAQYYLKLGDSNPWFLEVTGPKNYRPFPLPKDGVVVHTDTKDETYNLGIIEMETNFGYKIKVYDMEKTVCDFIKNRDRIEAESFVKCMHFYKRNKDKDLGRLYKYAKIMKIYDKVFEIMELLLNEE